MLKKFITAMTGLILVLPLSGQQLHEERFLIKPYLQFSTKTIISMLWETTEPGTSVVEYGEARLGAQKAILDKTARQEGTSLMHEVLLTGLQAETNYFWRAISVTEKGDTIRSDTYTFKTAVKDSSAFLFALIGDTQRNTRTPWAWAKIAEKVWQDRPNFVVLAGDLVDQGLRKTDWTNEFSPTDTR